jgi:uncharacterized protein
MSRRRTQGKGSTRAEGPGIAALPPAAPPPSAAPSGRRRIAARLGDPALEAVDLRVVGVLLLSSVLLTLYAYFGESRFYLANLAPRVNPALGVETAAGQSLIAFGYQSAHAVAWRILVPLAWIVLVLRDRPREYGFRMPEPGHRAVYLVLYLLMLPVLAAVSFLPSFRAMYPIWGEAFASPGILVPYLLAYGLRFAAVEAFFRGFLLFALYRRFGYHAVAIMVVPYCMIHFGKPFAETLGSIGAGLLLGYLALRGRSWVPGALLHWGIAISMDLLGLAQRHLNP